MALKLSIPNGVFPKKGTFQKKKKEEDNQAFMDLMGIKNNNVSAIGTNTSNGATMPPTNQPPIIEGFKQDTTTQTTQTTNTDGKLPNGSTYSIDKNPDGTYTYEDSTGKKILNKQEYQDWLSSSPTASGGQSVVKSPYQNVQDIQQNQARMLAESTPGTPEYQQKALDQLIKKYGNPQIQDKGMIAPEGVDSSLMGGLSTVALQAGAGATAGAVFGSKGGAAGGLIGAGIGALGGTISGIFTVVKNVDREKVSQANTNFVKAKSNINKLRLAAKAGVPSEQIMSAFYRELETISIAKANLEYESRNEAIEYLSGGKDKLIAIDAYDRELREIVYPRLLAELAKQDMAGGSSDLDIEDLGYSFGDEEQ